MSYYCPSTYAVSPSSSMPVYRPHPVIPCTHPAPTHHFTSYGATNYYGTPVLVPNPFCRYVTKTGKISPPTVPNPYFGYVTRSGKISPPMVPNPYFGFVSSDGSITPPRSISPYSSCSYAGSYRTKSSIHRTPSLSSPPLSTVSEADSGLINYYDEASSDDNEYESLETDSSSSISDPCSNSPSVSATTQLKQLLAKSSIPSHLVSLRSPSSRHLSSCALSRDETETLRYLALTRPTMDGLLDFTNEDIDDYASLARI